MDSPFVRCRKEDGYKQGWLLCLLKCVVVQPCRRRGYQFFHLAENLRHLYLVSNRLYCAKELHFEALVPDRQEMFPGWQNVGLFSMSDLDNARGYCQAPLWSAQFEVSIQLFGLTSLIWLITVDL